MSKLQELISMKPILENAFDIKKGELINILRNHVELVLETIGIGICDKITRYTNERYSTFDIHKIESIPKISNILNNPNPTLFEKVFHLKSKNEILAEKMIKCEINDHKLKLKTDKRNRYIFNKEMTSYFKITEYYEMMYGVDDIIINFIDLDFENMFLDQLRITATLEEDVNLNEVIQILTLDKLCIDSELERFHEEFTIQFFNKTKEKGIYY